MPDTIDRLVRLRGTPPGSKPLVIDPGERGLYSARDQPRPLGPRRYGVDPRRRRPGSVEHAAGGRRTGGPAAGGISAMPDQRPRIPRPPLSGRRRLAASGTTRTAAGLDG